MNKLIIYFALFFLGFSALKAEVVQNINIDGNKRVSDETIKIYGI